MKTRTQRRSIQPRLVTVVLVAAIGCTDARGPLEPPANGPSFAMSPAEVDGLSADLVLTGSGMVADGIGLHSGAGTITVDVPAGADVTAAFLYWEARSPVFGPHLVSNYETIIVNGGARTGQFIGGNNPDLAGRSFSYRVDVTDLIGSGANSVDVDATALLPFGDINGASVLVVFDDGTAGTIDVRDGDDFAFLPLPTVETSTTRLQTFTFPSSLSDRVADLWLIVGDVEGDRPNRIEISVGGATQSFETSPFDGLHDAFGDGTDGRDGDEWDTKLIEVAIPAGADELTVQVFSYQPRLGDPASLAWVAAGLSVPQDHIASGRMTGGGVVRLMGIGGETVRITHGFTLHCDILLSNNLEINWDGHQWHLEKESLEDVLCTDEPDVAPEPPVAPFDTFRARAVGRFDGMPGYEIEFILQDAGEPGGKEDKAAMSITAPNGDVVLEVPFGPTVHGNLQAHFDQPHGSNE